MLGLIVGLTVIARDIPKAYTDGRLSAERLSRLSERPDAGAVAATHAVKIEAEALPPSEPGR